MADTYGAKTLPLAGVGGSLPATPTAVEASGDPLLAFLASYLMTAANARLGAEWGVIAAPNRAPAAPESPIFRAFTHDPEAWDFNDKLLPALFVYRSDDGGGAYEQLTADLRVARDTVILFWIPRSTPQTRRADQARFASKLFALFDTLLEENRDPTWVVEGDTETRAALDGSSLRDVAQLYSVQMRRSPKRRLLDLRWPSDDVTATYTGFEGALEVREPYVRDPARDGALTGLEVSLTTPPSTDPDAPPPLVTQGFTLGDVPPADD
jgi:hypothetical protein